MSNPQAAVERFYAALARLTPRQWISTVTGVDVQAYEGGLSSAREALAGMAAAPPDDDARATLLMLQDTAPGVFVDLWPDLQALRDDLRPFARPGAADLTKDQYDLLRSQAERQFRFGASGVGLAAYLSSSELASVFLPFEALVSLSDILNPEPSFEDDFALAFLIATRWAAEHTPFSAPRWRSLFWQQGVADWLMRLTGQGDPLMRAVMVPNMWIGSALMTAAIALLPDGGGKDWRYRTLPMRRAAEELIESGSDAEIQRALAEFRRWQPLARQHRRWIVSRLVRVMEAMLAREHSNGTKTAEPTAESLAVIDRTLDAMGFEPADREPASPAGGMLTLPASLVWWRPSRVDPSALGQAPADAPTAGVEALAPPEAHSRNVNLVAQSDHFESAFDWYVEDVLPFIDDYASPPGQSRVPEIGASRFSSSIPYQRQTDEVRLLLYALADSLLVLAQAKEQAGEDSTPLHRRRLPLIRTLWWEEADAAARAALGMRTADSGPQLGDPALSGFMEKLSQARDRVESSMRRFLKLPDLADVTLADELSAFQIATAARAAEHVARAQSQRVGCGTSTLAVVAFGSVGLALVKALAWERLTKSSPWDGDAKMKFPD